MLNFRRIAVVGIVTTICCAAIGHHCDAAKKRAVIRRLTLDKSARVVELFSGIEAGELTSRVSIKDETSSTVYINNETNEPLTVELPKAVAAVHVLKQVLPQIGGAQNQGPNQLGNGAGSGQSQSVGGQLGQQGNQGLNGGINQLGNGVNNGFNPGGGSGLFSIPPEATVALTLNSVCLEHGRKTPMAAMKYELRPVESVVGNQPDLVNLLTQFDPAPKNRKAVQAAAWHLANAMTWDQLKSKKRRPLGRPATQWFAQSDLESARKQVAHARSPIEKPQAIVGQSQIRTAKTVDGT